MYNVAWSHLDNVAQGIFPIQCSPKSIKTTLNWAFSCAMLPRASWTTLLKIFVYSMLLQEN